MLKIFLKVKYFIKKGNKNALILVEKSSAIVTEHLNKKIQCQLYQNAS